MDNMHLQLKSFIDKHPDIMSIRIEYNSASYIVLSIRCLDKDSGLMKGNSKAISYEDFSDNEKSVLMYILPIMYDECQHLDV